MRRVLLVSAMALGALVCGPAYAIDYSSWKCTGSEFVAAFRDAMNTSPQFVQTGMKVVSITDPETLEATSGQLICRAMFEFASGEKVDETFVLKDNDAGHMVWGYKPTAN
jgi:hypothetical protein